MAERDMYADWKKKIITNQKNDVSEINMVMFCTVGAKPYKQDQLAIN